MLIYELPISLYSFKLRLAMRLKGVEIERRPPPGGSYRSDAYRAINPAGTIPALVDARGVLAETDAIIEYLDDLGLGKPLRPADPWLAARHRMLSRWCDMQLEPAVRRLFPLAGASREEALIAEADVLITAKLALIEAGLHAVGPFAVGDKPGLADCGLAAVHAWLQPIGAFMGLQAKAGPRLARLAADMAEQPAIRDEIAGYAAMVASWLESKRQGEA